MSIEAVLPDGAVPTSDPAIVELPTGRRIFSDDAIQGAIDQALVAASPESTFVVVAYGDLQGAHLTALWRGPAGFSAAGILRTDYHGQLSAAAEIRFER